MNKKIKIGVLSAAMIALPIATVISCGNKEIGKKPKVIKPEVIKPKVTKPEVTKPKVTKPEVTKPEVTKPEVTKPEVKTPATETPVVQNVVVNNLYNILNIDVLKNDKRESLLNVKGWPKRDANFDITKNKEIFDKKNEKFTLDISYPPKLIWVRTLKKHKEGKVINKTIILNRDEFIALSKFFTKSIDTYGLKGDQKLPDTITHDRKELVDIINKIKHPRSARSWKAIV